MSKNNLPPRMLQISIGYGTRILMPVEMSQYLGQFVQIAQSYVDPDPSNTNNYDQYLHLVPGEVCQISIIETSEIEPCERTKPQADPKPVDDPPSIVGPKMTALPLTNDEQTVKPSELPETRSFVDEYREDES